jgi:hypothetical protein
MYPPWYPSHSRNATQPSFKHFQTDGGVAAFSAGGFSYFDMSCRLLQELGLVTAELGPATAFTGLTTCFELRTYGVAESLAVLHSLPLFMQDFVTQKPKDYGEKVQAAGSRFERQQNEALSLFVFFSFVGVVLCALPCLSVCCVAYAYAFVALKIDVQVEFFARLMHFVDRQPPYKGVPGVVSRFDHVAGLPDSTSLGAMPFITKYPERQASWDEWEAFFVASQARFQALPADLVADLERTGAMAALQLPVPPGAPIDGTAFACILNNKLPLDLPSPVKHDLKKRLFHVGTVVMKMHNCLLQPGIYQGLELLLRKSFTRLK